MWKWRTGEIRDRLEVPRHRISCVAISADGSTIVWGFVVLKPRHDAECGFSGEYDPPPPWQVDRTVRVWRPFEEGAALSVLLAAHGGSVTCVAVSTDGRTVVSGSGDRTVRVWPMDGPSRGKVCSVLRSFGGSSLDPLAYKAQLSLSTQVSSNLSEVLRQLGAVVQHKPALGGAAVVLSTAPVERSGCWFHVF